MIYVTYIIYKNTSFGEAWTEDEIKMKFLLESK